MAKKVSVIIPIYNEERFIADCLNAVLKQDYPQEYMECLCIDGQSKDGTVRIIKEFISKYPQLFTLYTNPNKTQSYAMNIGIEKAKGDYIIRLDAHAEYPGNYISSCVECLEKVNADNVGGTVTTVGKTSVGRAIAKMLSSSFGVGNSQFRTGSKSGYVDTVPFGAFRKDIFQKIGDFDTRLDRNEDNEINFRIRRNGGKVYLSDDIKSIYYCRDTYRGIARMARQNGLWNVITMRLCPGAMGIRHFIPMLFLLSIIGLLVIGFLFKPFLYLLLAELLLYFLLDVLFSAKVAESSAEFFKLIGLFPLFHLSYGSGSLAGIIKLLSGRYNNRSE